MEILALFYGADASTKSVTRYQKLASGLWVEPIEFKIAPAFKNNQPERVTRRFFCLDEENVVINSSCCMKGPVKKVEIES